MKRLHEALQACFTRRISSGGQYHQNRIWAVGQNAQRGNQRLFASVRPICDDDYTVVFFELLALRKSAQRGS